MRFTAQDDDFRADVRKWLEANLTGEFAARAAWAGSPRLRWPSSAARPCSASRSASAATWTTCSTSPARPGAASNPVIRDRLARAWTGLAVIRAYALATLDGDDPAEASILKVLWSRWHRALGLPR